MTIRLAARAWAECRALFAAGARGRAMRASVAGALLLEILVGALGYQNGLGAFDGLFNDCVALLAVRAPSSAPPANATPLQNAFFNALATAAGLCALLLWGRRVRSLVVVLGAMALVLAAAAALQLGFGLRMGPVAALAGLALCYPWWILYRQEARLRHLGDEFARMAADPQALPRALAPVSYTHLTLPTKRIV